MHGYQQFSFDLIVHIDLYAVHFNAWFVKKEGVENHIAHISDETTVHGFKLKIFQIAAKSRAHDALTQTC